MMEMQAHVERFDASIVFDHIEQVDLQSKPFRLGGTQDYSCDALIIATGLQPNTLACPVRKLSWARASAPARPATAFTYRGKEVAVVGGGNTAVEEAVADAAIVASALVHRRDALRSEKVLQDRLFARAEEGKVVLHWHRTLEEVLGDASGVTGLRLQSTQGEAAAQLDVAGVFIAIGHKPNTDIFSGQLDMEGGYIQVRSGLAGEATLTSVPRRICRGRCGRSCRQAVTSAGFGCMAALDAEADLDGIGA